MSNLFVLFEVCVKGYLYPILVLYNIASCSEAQAVVTIKQWRL